MMAINKYFSALLGPSFVEGSQEKVTLDEIDGETLEAIVKYCYTRRIEVNDANDDQIIAAASAMEFPDIGEIVGQYWSTKLNAGNCLEILTKADIYSLQTLKRKALIFCAMEFDHLPSHDKLKIDGRVLQELLKCEEIKITEEKIFVFVVTWVEQNEKYRAKFVQEILKLIRLKHITSRVGSSSMQSFVVLFTIINFSFCVKRLFHSSASTIAVNWSVRRSKSELMMIAT